MAELVAPVLLVLPSTTDPTLKTILLLATYKILSYTFLFHSLPSGKFVILVYNFLFCCYCLYSISLHIWDDCCPFLLCIRCWQIFWKLAPNIGGIILFLHILIPMGVSSLFYQHTSLALKPNWFSLEFYWTRLFQEIPFSIVKIEYLKLSMEPIHTHKNPLFLLLSMFSIALWTISEYQI